MPELIPAHNLLEKCTIPTFRYRCYILFTFSILKVTNVDIKLFSETEFPILMLLIVQLQNQEH